MPDTEKGSVEASQGGSLRSDSVLVDAREVARNPSWRLFDCTHDGNDPVAGQKAYELAHIPGATFASIEHDLSAPAGVAGRHPLPKAEEFAAWLGSQGVLPTDRIVAYDRGAGHAARLWWMLRWIGHDRAAVLDGGFDAWRSAGLPVTSAVPTHYPTTLPARVRADLVIDAAAIRADLKTRRFLLIDARRQARYAGEEIAVDGVPGHIPGARNRPHAMNLDENGRFKPRLTLVQEFTELLGTHSPSTVVNLCGSGILACHNLLAMEIAGLTGASFYPGSWSEWSSLPSPPIVTGSLPG